MKSWKTQDRKLVLENARWLTVEYHTIELPDGRVLPNWPWIITPDYINLVAVTEDERFICFRQVKYGIQGETLAVVGGYVDEGEAPLAAAKRELLEETLQHIDEPRLETDLAYRFGYLTEFMGFAEDDIAAIHGAAAHLAPLVPFRRKDPHAQSRQRRA